MHVLICPNNEKYSRWKEKICENWQQIRKMIKNFFMIWDSSSHPDSLFCFYLGFINEILFGVMENQNLTSHSFMMNKWKLEIKQYYNLLGPYGLVTADISSLLVGLPSQCILKQDQEYRRYATSSRKGNKNEKHKWSKKTFHNYSQIWLIFEIVWTHYIYILHLKLLFFKPCTIMSQLN